ncbi:hypothetical protein EYF80_048016 [Liparis tanakae]|uniref:Uncharacterized protein n=1 Tax=Liparis tanakae TaxID=230148 RepID=A0A4Z2FLK8_9TELE|nr:hypothetical protein EYF80_048016 [Liparis tanakae]
MAVLTDEERRLKTTQSADNEKFLQPGVVDNGVQERSDLPTHPVHQPEYTTFVFTSQSCWTELYFHHLTLNLQLLRGVGV